MSAMQYLDEAGNPVLTYSTSHPSILVVPPDRKPDDAIEISDRQFKQHLDRVERDFKPPESLQDQIRALKDDVAKLKADKPGK